MRPDDTDGGLALPTEATPKRLRRRRTPGWRMPAGAVYVGRGSRWGNPWRIWREDDGRWWASAGSVHDGPHVSRHAAALAACRRFRCDALDTRTDHQRRAPMAVDLAKHLRGRDLVCWCPLCDRHADGLPLGTACDHCAPCHADVVLALANAPEALRHG